MRGVIDAAHHNLILLPPGDGDASILDHGLVTGPEPPIPHERRPRQFRRGMIVNKTGRTAHLQMSQEPIRQGSAIFIDNARFRARERLTH